MAIKIPKGLGSPASINKRASHAIDRDTAWRDILQDAYDYFLPQREVLDFHSPGQKKMSQIFDSTAVFGMKEFANRMQANLTPIWRNWATFQMSAEVEQAAIDDPNVDVDEIRKKLEDAANIVFDYINHSNFATQINEAYLDLGIGTAAMMVEESDDPVKLIEFKTMPQVEMGFETGPHGRIENVFKFIKAKGRNLERQFPGIELDQQLRDKVKRDPEADCVFLHAMLFNQDPREYWSVLIPKGSEKVVWAQNYGEFGPWVVGRWSVISGEIRGRGPALDVLPDVKSLNKIKEFSLRKAAIDLSGIWTAVDDGVTNPYTIRIQPGIVIPVATNDRTSPSLLRLDTGSDLSLTQFNVGEMQTSIRRTLFNDLRDPTGPVRSATEISIDSRELAQRMGSAFGRLQTEILEPVLNRVLAILKKHGKVPDIRVDGRDVTIKFTSPLARAQDMDELLAAEQAVAFVANTIGPESIPLQFNVANFGRFAASKTGMSTDLVLTEADQQKATDAAVAAAAAEAEASSGSQSGDQAMSLVG